MKASYALYVLLVFLINQTSIKAQDVLHDWPDVKKESKPWTRWWWMGSAVDKTNITQTLISFNKAGIGGVEIEPIFGVKGAEENFIDYLSPEWIEMLDHTVYVADSLQMGVDLTLGTGWPWGGSEVSLLDAAKRLLVRKIDLKKGTPFLESISPFETGVLVHPKSLKIRTNKKGSVQPKLQGVYAFDPQNHFTDLSGMIQNNSLKWGPQDQDHELFFVFEDRTAQKVKRAAPGGEGWVLDHFSPEALKNYLQTFSQTLVEMKVPIRSVFNDSYEVYNADYTTDFFEIFEHYRGYDLKPYMNRLLDKNDNEISNRIRSDYRETLSDLLIEDFNPTWNEWAQKMGFKTKYQAHGAPGNLIDLYASADIPECETFGSMPYAIKGFRRVEGNGSSSKYPHRNFRAGDADAAMIKFSSSAANITGKQKVSAETFTWLREHFRASLSQCKPELEDLFLNGINHIFLHGSTYSPASAAWPGWKFYASVNFNETNPIWEDAPALFEYIGRSQSLLQLGNADNDLLIYWPIHDSWAKFNEGDPLVQFAIHRLDTWLSGTSFYDTAHHLIKQGYGFDYLSDRFLEKVDVENGIIQLPGGNYHSIVVPKAQYMPLESLKKLLDLRQLGASVIFLGRPQQVPGFLDYQKKSDALQTLAEDKINKIYTLKEMEIPLQKAGVIQEPMVNKGLKFVRREHQGEKIYFVVNHTPKKIEGLIPLGVSDKEVLIMDPLTGKTGKAITTHYNKMTKVKLSLPSGGSLFLKTFDKVRAPQWNYLTRSENSYKISGEWDFRLIKGGPDNDFLKKINRLASWTEWGEKMKAFSGTAEYQITFNRPTNHNGAWLLELGDVRESAKVWLNDELLGTLWSNPYEMTIGNLKKVKNTLRIQVTNLGSNRIKAKEARGEPWKIFYDINMVSLDYNPFDASKLDVLKAGLLEEPLLTPLKTSEYK
ncbi:MAG: glycoside hydrolase [Flavobacteriaceae bacterium]|nr:glycoside hydrolase [Flavobacteriaceae bacterium]